jgi:hypothetical protein
MKPVRGIFRMYLWPEEYNVVPPENHDLVSFNVSIKVRSRVYSGGMQKIMDKLKGRVDGTFGA